MRSVWDKFMSIWRALFGDTVRAFGIVSILLLIALAIAPAKEHFTQWRHYQRQYLKLIGNRSDATVLRRHFQPGIQQIWLPKLGVVDRCQTCHQGLTEASLTGVRMEPFRKHPVIPHSLTQFGCVICHQGQGAATTVAEAHDSELDGEGPILPDRYMESSCGQCHHAPLPGTPKLNEGREMLSSYGCVHCHTIKLPDGSTVEPTDNPPPLTHIADKTTRDWIYKWLKNPSGYSSSATMPNFLLSDADARDISAFLIADSTPLAADSASLIPVSAKIAADPSAGAVLYGESFCASCHATQNAAGNLVGGDLGPELTNIGTKAKAGWLQAWLRDPRAYDPNTPMPSYRWTDQQLAVLTTYLQGKTDSDYLADVHLAPATPAQVAHGKALVIEYGCASCHTIRGIEKPKNFAPDLSRAGSLPMAQLVFIAGMRHTVPAFIAGKIRNPRAFGDGLRMPRYNFSSTQIDAVTTALLALTDRSFTLPARLQIPSPQPSHYEPAGKAGVLMAQLKCLSCHRINGHGGTMAPDLSWEGSAVQRQWLYNFLKNPNTLRPALIRRMPKFNLTDDEATELTDYIMTAYQTPAFDRDSMPLTGYPPALVEQGRQLYYSKYACQSCHILNTQQDKGYIGPTLTHVGSRLNAAWIYSWLKNPQALRPGTIEPNQNISDEDARALTAFLMSQKGSGTQEAKR